MLRLITFGGLRIENGTIVNGAANPRSRLAILAVIAAGGEGGVRRETLTAMFWPDSDDERARNALRQALFVLKRDAGGISLTTGVADLRLNAERISCDAVEFEAAIAAEKWEEAVSLYAGPFLNGVILRETPEFERWVEEQRQRYSNAFGRALEALAAAAVAAGDLPRAVSWWERRSQHDPFSARVAVGFMQALAANGERERAILFAAQYAERLRLELELEPEAEVVALAGAMRSSSRRVTQVDAGRARDSATANATLSPTSTAHEDRLESVDHIGTDARPASGSRRRIVWTLAGAALVLSALLWQGGIKSADPLRVQVSIAAPADDSTLSQLVNAARSDVQRHVATDGHVQVVDDSLAPLAPSADWIVSTRLDTSHDSIVANTRVIDRETGVTIAHLEPLTAHHSASVALLAKVRDGVRGALAALTDTLYEPWSRAHSRPPTYPAFQAFMEGMDAVANQGPREAAAAFRRAMVLDPEFVEAKIWYLEHADAFNAPDIDSVIAVARTQRHRMSPYDQYALDRQIAFMHGELENAFMAARRLYMVAPQVHDAQVMMVFAAMSTRRYREVLRIVHQMDRSRGWLSTLPQLRTFDLNAHRLLGELSTALREWRAMRAANPTDFGLCFEGSMLYGALGDEAGLQALTVECAALPGAPNEVSGMWEQGGRAMRSRGHHDASRRTFERALAIRRSLLNGRPGPRHDLAVVLSELGEWTEAYEVMKGGINMESPLHRMRMGIIAAHAGDTAVAHEAIAFFDQRPPSRRGTPEADEARGFIHLALGHIDEGTRFLIRARDRGKAPGFNNWYLRFELEPLRGSPRYNELLAPR